MGIGNDYIQRLSNSGSDKRDRYIKRTQHIIDLRAIENPNCKEVSVNSLKQRLIVLTTEEDTKKEFYTMPNERVNFGDLISWNDMHFLVTSVDYDDDVCMKGYMYQCNHIIKWQNPETKEILERWAVFQNPYTTNIDADNEIQTSKQQYRVYIQNDSETILVDLDKRFIVETINNQPKVYIITRTDCQTCSYDPFGGGLLIWGMERGEYNPRTDNAELMIADYIKPETEDTNDITLTYDGNLEVIIGDSSKSFTFGGTFNLATDTITYTINNDTMSNYDISVDENVFKVKALRKASKNATIVLNVLRDNEVIQNYEIEVNTIL